MPVCVLLGLWAWAHTPPRAAITGDDAREAGHRHRHHPRHDTRDGTAETPAPREAPSPAPAPESTPHERTDGCPAGMLRVTGAYCDDAHQRCEEMDDDGRERCLRFRKPVRCGSRRTRPMDFCIDRYEWPNREGVLPQVLSSWNDAAAACASLGRRLCAEDEWTLACEGDAMQPYPYGYARDETACNIDRHNLPYDHGAVSGDDRGRADAEMMRVSQARPSGAFPRCVSPYGVRDMTGNVDEWAVSRTGAPFRSVLKGGYWGRIRARCRPATRRHDEGFRYYQIGFRCCAEAGRTEGGGAAVTASGAPR